MVGLVNVGNTCYFNSFVQCLFLTDRFRNHLMTTDFSRMEAVKGTYFNAVTVTQQLQLVLAFLSFSQRSSYTPDNLIKCLPEGTNQFNEIRCIIQCA